MQPEDKLLIACTRQTFHAEHRQIAHELCAQHRISWDYVLSTATLHGVAPLVFANLQRFSTDHLGIPHTVIAQFEHATHRAVALKSGLAVKLAEVLAFFQSRSIEVMLLKGAALDLLIYRQPWYTMHDVDLLIRPPKDALSNQDSAAIDALFSQLPGFEYDFYTHHDVTMNSVLPVDFRRIWQDAVLIECRGQPVWVMCPEDMLLAACINSCRKRFLRLKSLLDIAEIVSHYPAICWEKLTNTAQVYACNTIVYTALLVTQLTIGCTIPSEVFDHLAVGRMRRAAIHTIVRYLLQHISLSAAYPFSGPEVLGRNVTWSLLLPYVTYQPVQVWRKAKEIYTLKALSDGA